LAGQRAVTQLALMMRVLASSYERSPTAGRVYTLAWVKWGGPILEEPILAVQFAGVIAEGQRRGEIRADVDAETAGRLIRRLLRRAVAVGIALSPGRRAITGSTEVRSRQWCRLRISPR
jgi:hypothetical protein